MISVPCRMISPAPQPGPFTRDMPKLTVRDVVCASDVPEFATRLVVRLQFVRATGDALPVQGVVLEANQW